MRVLKLEGLVKAWLRKRVNRFTVEVEVDGSPVKAHLTNTGRLQEYLVNGRKSLLARIKGPRLSYRLIAVEDGDGYAVVDTISQQRVFESLVRDNSIPWLKDCFIVKRNYRIEGEVIDYLIECHGLQRLVELKSSVLRTVDNYASYPDCPTDRGVRQIETLARFAEKYKPLVVFIAALPRVKGFKPFCRGDPRILEAVMNASMKGVVFKSINTYMVDESGWIVLENPDLPVLLEC
ncbi:DNA/RNA nuclease SfsA [Thermosphaera chiliense]|uniref:DNA/RNA nuclease SfsA n=1 Tax=Thermosphaera chiliense TaxID=3402707 RepID=A0A7M1US33_9CREN|nr:DNA/RNA nuclease SfsA [Thermosphaera aggregans]